MHSVPHLANAAFYAGFEHSSNTCRASKLITGSRNIVILTGLMLMMATLSQSQTADEISIAHKHLNAWREKHIALWMNDFGDLELYRAANSALAQPLPDQKRVIFFGDSITAGWQLDKFFPRKGYVNRGIGGQTTSQMLLRFRQDVIDLKPAVVIILAGTNDTAEVTGPISIADIESNLATMAELAKIHDISVVFSSITPVNNYVPVKDEFINRPSAKILELNEWLKDYCARNDLVYLDYFRALVDKAGMLRKGLSKGDGLHPNDECYKIMAPLASDAIEKSLHGAS